MTYINKMVDGVEVALTPQEIADLEARDAAWLAGDSVRQAKTERQNALEADQTVVDWMDRLANLTPTQIDNYFATNVTSPAQASAVLKGIVKYLALKS